MEPRGSIADAASNALVATVGFYTRALEQSRREADGYFMATRGAHRHADDLRLKLVTLARDHQQLFEFAQRVGPVIEALDVYLKPVRIGSPKDYNEGSEARNLAALHRAWLAARDDGGLVPPPASPRPDEARASPDGSPKRDA